MHAKAGSNATLPQQEKNNPADVQRDWENITGFIRAVVSYFSRGCTFGEFESLAVASWRRWRMFLELLRCLRLRHNIFGEGIRRPCWGNTCGGVLRAMARIASAWFATPR